MEQTQEEKIATKKAELEEDKKKAAKVPKKGKKGKKKD